MKLKQIVAGTVALTLLAGWTAQTQAQVYIAKAGAKLRIEGTSNIHDWQMISPFIGGSVDLGAGFPKETGAAGSGKIEVKGDIFVPAGSLYSIEKTGQKYSDKMDDIAHEHLHADKYPRIVFRLESVTVKSAPKTADGPYACEASGTLAVAGVTNAITVPIDVQPQANKLVKISGTTTVKMSDYKVEPPSPTGLGLLIKTGDEVKVIFDLLLGPKPTPAAK